MKPVNQYIQGHRVDEARIRVIKVLFKKKVEIWFCHFVSQDIAFRRLSFNLTDSHFISQRPIAYKCISKVGHGSFGFKTRRHNGFFLFVQVIGPWPSDLPSHFQTPCKCHTGVERKQRMQMKATFIHLKLSYTKSHIYLVYVPCSVFSHTHHNYTWYGLMKPAVRGWLPTVVGRA